MFVRCDVRKASEIKNSIDKTIESFGRLDILINNAGTLDVRELHDYSEEDWD